jgi:hypothetical protein
MNRLANNPYCQSSQTLQTSSEATTWADDQSNLIGINCQIKAELTSLLNSEAVKGSGRLRAWVQDRLMEVEKASRKQRRRKSNASISENRFGGNRC